MLRTPIRRSRNHQREGKVLFGCLVALGVFVVLAITATVIVYMNIRHIAAKGVAYVANATVEQLPVDDQEKSEILGEIDMLLRRYTSKEITNDQLEQVVESLSESPAIPAALMMSASSAYLDPSALTDEEKLDGARQLQRFAHGLHTEQIGPEKINDILAILEAGPGQSEVITLGTHIGTSGKEDFRIVAPSVATREQLTQIIELARVQSDEVEIDQDLPEIDLSDSIHDAIVDAIGEDPNAEPEDIPDP